MFKKIKAFFHRPPKARTESEELLRQALLSRDLMSSLEIARKEKRNILVQISAPGRTHVFSVPGNADAAAALYDIAAGNWHANLAESRILFDKEAEMRLREEEERLRPRLPEVENDYDMTR